MPENRQRYVVRFTGHVQNVGFRATCLAKAYDLPINGLVRNESDGSVLLDIDAAPADAKELIARIKTAMERNIDDTIIQQSPTLGRTDGFHVAF